MGKVEKQTVRFGRAEHPLMLCNKWPSLIKLHHFSDASVNGYSQWLYLQLVNNSDPSSLLISFGKALVTPLKNVIVPCQELTAALVSTKVSSIL